MNFEINWHKRFLQQARWTKSLRDYLFDRAQLPTIAKILEIGCGTGAILSDLKGLSSGGGPTLFGIDLQASHLRLAAPARPPGAAGLRRRSRTAVSGSQL